MSISVSQTNGYTESGSASTVHTKTGLTTTAGRAILVAVAYHGETGGVVTDSAGNEYRLLCAATRGAAGTAYVEIWGTVDDSPAALSSGSITVTSAVSCGVAFRMFELTGTQMPVTNWLLGKVGNSQAAATAMTSLATGTSLNTTDLSICAFATDGAATVTASTFTAGAASVTSVDSSTTTGSVVQLTTAYRLMTAVTSQTYTATLGTARNIASVITNITANNGTFGAVIVEPVIADGRTYATQVVTPIVTPPTGYVGQFIPPPTEIDRVT